MSANREGHSSSALTSSSSTAASSSSWEDFVEDVELRIKLINDRGDKLRRWTDRVVTEADAKASRKDYQKLKDVHADELTMLLQEMKRMLLREQHQQQQNGEDQQQHRPQPNRLSVKARLNRITVLSTSAMQALENQQTATEILFHRIQMVEKKAATAGAGSAAFSSSTSRGRTPQQRKPIDYDDDFDEDDELLEDTTAKQQVTKELELTPNQRTELDLRRRLEDQRQQEIGEIAEAVKDVNECMTDLRMLINDQGEELDKVEVAVTKSERDTTAGVEELREARRRQKGGQLTKWLLILAVVIFVGLLLVVLLVKD